MNDSSTWYIMGELLHSSFADRDKPKRGGNDGLLEGNFISFAIACRWIKDIIYVHHPEMRVNNLGIHDIGKSLFENNNPHCGLIQLKKLTLDCRRDVGRRLSEFGPIALEPPVPIQLIECHQFSITIPFSFMFVAQSPNYTPAASDDLLDVIRQFIDEGDSTA